MEPLDLTKRPPRGPREQLDGLILMPRTIDKVRSTLPGGNPGSYKVAGFSARLLERLGVKEEDLREAVRGASSDQDVAIWLRAHTEADRYPEHNAFFESLVHEKLKDPAGFDERYPVRKRLGLSKLLDVLEADDRESFESLT
jgi:hypothetical protein